MLWLVDRMVVGRWWRRQQPQVHRISLSADYMLLCWDQKIALPRAIAPELYFRLVDSGCMERAHVVTGFQKRLPGLALPGMPPTAQAAPGAGRTSPPAQSPGLQAGWSCAAVVRVYHTPRSPVVQRKDRISHTHRVAESNMKADGVNGAPLHIWGPFTSDMSRQVYDAIHGADGEVWPPTVEPCVESPGHA